MLPSAVLMTYQPITDVIADLPAIAGLGFDGVMSYTESPTNPGYGVAPTLGLLDACLHNGLRAVVDLRQYVTGNPYDEAMLKTRVNGVKDHPALAGWYAYDEPRTVDVAPGQIEAAYAAIKATGSTAPVVGIYPGYGPLWWPFDNSAYPLTAGMQDIFSVDTYPINGNGLNETEYRNWLAGSFGSMPPAITERVMCMQACALSSGQVPTAAQLLRLAEIAAEERWCTRGMWMWLWDWGSTLSPLTGYVFLKQMVADAPTAAAVRTINARHRSNVGKGIGLGGGGRLRASPAALLTA